MVVRRFTCKMGLVVGLTAGAVSLGLNALLPVAWAQGTGANPPQSPLEVRELRVAPTGPKNLANAPVSFPRAEVGIDLSTPSARAFTVGQLKARSENEKDEAEAYAVQHGLELRTEYDGTTRELMAIVGGRPLYNTTMNVNAGISTGANQIRNTAPYNLNGAGLVVGLWDGNDVRASHVEFGGRVTVVDSVGVGDHATHVAGTIGAAGVNAAALGMAPSISIDSYDWNSDTAEATAAAATGPGNPSAIFLSNHSYGYALGWYPYLARVNGVLGYYWRWPIEYLLGFPEDPYFGFYDSICVTWDDIVYQAQYYLPIWAAGNDRDDNPVEGDIVLITVNGVLGAYYYDSSIMPLGDGTRESGYDTMAVRAGAKNLLAVGAVDDAVSGGARDVGSASMAGFSVWGPTDDGRVKPDVVGNGVDLFSSVATSNSSYDGKDGTSMAAPNATGSAALLVEYYGEKFPGQAMRASTLKGLLIHTADDLGNAGPDYSSGWGLVNVKAAADVIALACDYPSVPVITEDTIGDSSMDTYSVVSDGSTPIRVTLCWTDPPGTAASTMDDTTPRLVNDLDVRVIGPGGSPRLYPYVLDPSNPASLPTSGDNTRDNVEQIYIPSVVRGEYDVQVHHFAYKGSALTNPPQHYSLIITGAVPLDSFTGDPSEYTYTLLPNGDVTVTDIVPGRDGTATLPDGTPGAVFAGVEYNLLVGTTGADTMNGTSDSDLLLGFAGNDRLNGRDGDDAIIGGEDDDYLIGGNNGDDILVGEGGEDRLFPGNGNNKCYAGPDRDWVFIDPSTGSNILDGGSGDSDTLKLVGTYTDFSLDGNHGFEIFKGGVGNDTIDGSLLNARCYYWGNDGNDTLKGGAKRDILRGGNGNDTLMNGVANDPGARDLFYGEAGDDTLYATGGDTNCYGGTGADTTMFSADPFDTGEYTNTWTGVTGRGTVKDLTSNRDGDTFLVDMETLSH